ncbi:hypothetical protein AB1Y20_015219 [Prymnesium parvum]|uniref:NYN domain-containing protein n=1 Tax=Prymnesium parvum TaxID=97485 RepID=A0AB34K1W6_PRYPA|mmetsp:Transcript_671/g.1371  ORF Transcript_671/g.1371 Transcript_671/m.1371 type:complete len:259 (+) Transcript_671:200-976(+)
MRIVLCDADNVRAGMGWPTCTAFRHAAYNWARRERASSPQTLLLIAADGRTEAQHACAAAEAEGVVLTFSGTRWKADDAIVRDCGWWLTHSEAGLLVVSSDKQLRRRCREMESLARGSGGGRLRFESSEAFAFALRASSSTSRLEEGATHLLRTASAQASTTDGHSPSPWSLTFAAPYPQTTTYVDTSPQCTESLGSDTLALLVNRFVSWIVSEQPRPARSAWEHVHGVGSSKPTSHKSGRKGKKTSKGSGRSRGVYK